MKLAISVWLWQRRLLLFVFLASLKLSLGICILSQGGLWVTVSAIVAWPGCLAVLRACFGLHTIRIGFEGVWGLVCHLIYPPFYILVGRVHNDYIGVVGNLLALYLFGRILSQMRMVFPFVFVMLKNYVVLSGPCFADVNVEKVGLLWPNIWTFWWCFGTALQNMWYIRWDFVYRCRRLVVEALRCFVFLWFKEITLFNEILLSWHICFSERLPRCCQP